MPHEEIDYEAQRFRFMTPSIYTYRRSYMGFRVETELPCDYDGHYCQKKIKIHIGYYVVCFLVGF